MIKTTWQFARENIIPLTAGSILAWASIFVMNPVSDLGSELHNRISPIISDWVVTEVAAEGSTLILHGTMIKRRNCVFVPPTIARDQTGLNYAVISKSGTAGKTWAVDDTPQRWGPWHVEGGVGKRLEFFNLYVCDHSRPNMAFLGTYPQTPNP